MSAGASMPARSAISRAGLPTRAGFGRAWGVTRTLATASDSAGDRKWPPRASNSRRTSPAIGSSTTTEFSDEHSTPLSKVLPATMSRTAFATSAERSM